MIRNCLPRPAAGKEEWGKRRKKKKGTVAVISCVLVLAICLAGLQAISSARKSSVPVAVSCLTLEPTTLQSTVTASGTVKSASTTNVYTNVSGCVVKDLHVEVGDYVEAGAILCQLDSETLEESLEKQKVSLSVSKNSSAQNISASEKQYQDAVENLDNGLNTTVNSARTATESALRALEKAQSDYDSARADIDDGMNSQLVQAEEALEQANLRVQRAEETYDKGSVVVPDLEIRWRSFTATAAVTWLCAPQTTRWPKACWQKSRYPAGRRRAIWFFPFFRTRSPPSSPAFWRRTVWAWSGWRSGRRVWRTSSWS